MQRFLLLLVLGLSLSGCSTFSAPASDSFSQLQYGATRTEIISRFQKPGIPLFRFVADHEAYSAEAYMPKGTYQSYAFFYQQNQLVAITTLEESVKIWGPFFNSYGWSLPHPATFNERIVKTLSSRLNIQNTDFSTVNKEKNAVRQGRVNETVVATLLMPAGLLFSIAAAPVVVPVVMADMASIERDKSTLINRINGIPLGASFSAVKSLLGEPTLEFGLGEATVLTFVPSIKGAAVSQRITVAFSEGNAIWFGYYFDDRM